MLLLENWIDNMVKSFSQETLKELENIISHFPNKKAALLPALRLAEREFQYLDMEACKIVADCLDLSQAYVYGVLTFYTHYNREWHGRYRIMVCCTLMCVLQNSLNIIDHIKNRLNIDLGQKTFNGLFSLEKVECLASCGTAPVIQINHDYYENLTIQKVDQILDRLESR